jgi:predicted RNA binding protein YcfA (HicA-like mRNA interferase family)
VEVAKLPRINAARLLRARARDGWYESRQTGSHKVLRHPTKSGPVAVPFHRGDLKTGTLNRILEQAGLTADDLRRLL